ncbi:tripartite motif-containing protein 16 [Perca flavescens]|uniref:tripartite motif-containing protein 16 n=1 Tax=Perca flavescens TaxID=8167 RepID=UPI00106DE48A|nr:tripartite motif-containing protein 16-like [Perca flavescens]
MATVIELLETLEDLGDKELKNFKWYLQQPDFLKDFPPIPKSRLENADRPDTVDLMVQTYSHVCVDVAKKVLKRMRRNDLVESLAITNPEPEGQSAAATSGAVEVDDIEETKNSKSRLENTDQPDAVDLMLQTYSHQCVDVANKVVKKMRRNDLMEGLSIIDPELEGQSAVATSGAVDVDDIEETSKKKAASSVHPQAASLSELPTVSRQTEDVMVPVLQPPQPNTLQKITLQSDLQNMFICAQDRWIEKQHKELLRDINPEVFVMDTGTEGKPMRTVLTNGIAGIGKSFIVQKFLLDWAEKRANQDLHLIFPFTVQQLKLWSGKRFRLAELIHTCIPEANVIKEETLNDIFTTLQNSRNSNFDKSEFKLLFVFDGLDDSLLRLDLMEKTTEYVDVTKSTTVDVLLTNLIRGNLLPSARLWITTQPAAANQIPPDCVDMVKEVKGFTDRQKEEYFRKRFRDEEQANRVMDHSGEQRLKPGVRKYACELELDPNTADRKLKLSHNNRKVICSEYQPYPDHPDRFESFYPQLLCKNELTGHCYWEVKWRGDVDIAVTYKGIRRKGNSKHCRVGVYVDCPAGTLSFYRVSSVSLIHLYTFNTTFTQPLYPGFGLGQIVWDNMGDFKSSVSL